MNQTCPKSISAADLVTGFCQRIQRSQHRARTLFLAIPILVLSASSFVSADAPYFMGLGFLPGTNVSAATAVSADGSVVVGVSGSSNGQAFRWTRAGGMIGLGVLPGRTSSGATAVSADGSVVVGDSASQAFRWTQSDGILGLGYLAGDSSSYAYNVSGDGSVVVGNSSDGNAEAYRWTQANGMDGLGFLPGGNSSGGFGISADGSVIVGRSSSSLGDQAYRWTQTEGMTGLGDLPGGSFFSSANAASSDGSVIVGYSDSATSVEAFRWTPVGGMVGLGMLPGATSSDSYCLSADGSVVMGRNYFPSSGFKTYYWTQALGIRPLRDLLVDDYGLDLSSWTLIDHPGNILSADGLTIVGYGIDPSGAYEGWVAHIPEPSAALLILIVPWFARQTRRRRSQP